jgi:hypothetical protein
MDSTLDEVNLLVLSFVPPLALAVPAVHWPYRRHRRIRQPPAS